MDSNHRFRATTSFVSRPRQTSPVAMILCGGNSDQAVKQSWINCRGERVGMVNVPLRVEKGFHPDLDDLASAVSPRTRVIWINSPHNPTGALFTADEIADTVGSPIVGPSICATPVQTA